MTELLSLPVFWMYLLLAIFGAANSSTRQWAQANYDTTPVFFTLFYQLFGISSLVVFIIGLAVIAYSFEWWYSIIVLIISQVINRIALSIFDALRIRHGINILSIIAIPVLIIILICLI